MRKIWQNMFDFVMDKAPRLNWWTEFVTKVTAYLLVFTFARMIFGQPFTADDARLAWMMLALTVCLNYKNDLREKHHTDMRIFQLNSYIEMLKDMIVDLRMHGSNK